MSRRRSLSILLVAVSLGACDQPSGLTGPVQPADGPAFSSVAVNCTGDATYDTQLIRDRVAQADILNFGATRCVVNDTINLDSNTVISGLGRTSTIFYNRPAYFEGAAGWDTAPFVVPHTAQNVVVEKMHFEGTQSMHQFAVLVYGGRNVTVRNSFFSKIGLVGSNARDNIETTDTARLAREIYVLNDTVLQGVCGGIVTCKGSSSRNNAIELTHVLDGEIRNNHIMNYTTGIAIVGGNAMTQPDRRRMAGRFLIHGNRVDQVDTGIMTSNAFEVNVNENFVTNCTDVCLDAEGSERVGFYANRAYDAGNYTIATFYNAEGVVFNWNHLRKDLTWTDENGTPRDNGQHSLYRAVRDDGSTYKRVGVKIHNNLFAWDGPGVGNVFKETAGPDDTSPSVNYILFDNNELHDVMVIWDWKQYDQGTIQMRGNTITFTKTPDRAAIGVVGTHLAGNKRSIPLNGDWNLEIAGNIIKNKSGQDPAKPAVDVLQNCACAVNTLIQANDIRGFSTSIKVTSSVYNPNTGRSEPRSDHYFGIHDNGVSGTVSTSSAATVNETGTYSVPNT
ncbi:MAG TPA: hypothetical protein VGR37_13050 [Longimicrobiaceae bacterium]|nr:hypothetical protein [Longimicrobiaceae bacterium]